MLYDFVYGFCMMLTMISVWLDDCCKCVYDASMVVLMICPCACVCLFYKCVYDLNVFVWCVYVLVYVCRVRCLFCLCFLYVCVCDCCMRVYILYALYELCMLCVYECSMILFMFVQRFGFLSSVCVCMVCVCCVRLSMRCVCCFVSDCLGCFAYVFLFVCLRFLYVCVWVVYVLVNGFLCVYDLCNCCVGDVIKFVLCVVVNVCRMCVCFLCCL